MLMLRLKVLFKKTNPPNTELELFWQLVQYICSRFVEVKKSAITNAFIRQFSYFTKTFWD